MRKTVSRVLLLLPVTLTVVPFPEMLLPMYYLAPSATTAAAIFTLALVVSCVQILYQYWVVGEVERMAPTWMSTAGAWLDKQASVKVLRRNTGLMIFLLGVCPGVRVVGTTLWRTSGHRMGGYFLVAGTAIQLAVIFGGMLGVGQLIRQLW